MSIKIEKKALDRLQLSSKTIGIQTVEINTRQCKVN